MLDVAFDQSTLVVTTSGAVVTDRPELSGLRGDGRTHCVDALQPYSLEARTTWLSQPGRTRINTSSVLSPLRLLTLCTSTVG